MNGWVAAALVWVFGGAVWTLVIWRQLRRSESAVRHVRTILDKSADGAAFWTAADKLFVDADNLFAEAERLFEAGQRDKTQGAKPCPACERVKDLGRTHPQLSVEQLMAVVRRQIDEGQCPAHSYADQP